VTDATPPLLSTPTALDDLLATLVDEEVYALDTEFHRERTYFPRLALVQLAWRDGLALIDPLAVDVATLRQVLAGPGLAVLHASDQDLEVLELACGTGPSRLFDTQIAAGFVGLSSPSLAVLHERFLGIRLPKGDRLTDWLARPLRESQLTYAASDVEHLLDLFDRLWGELAATGRLEWVSDECEEARRRARGPRDPTTAWTRIKEVRQLRGRKLAVAQEVAAWRETEAQARDVPVRFVLPDLAVVAIAQRLPTSRAELRSARGVEDRYLRNGVSEALLAAVDTGRRRETPWPGPATEGELDRRLRPAAALVSAWLSQQARDLDLDVSVLATRSDIEAFLRGDPSARLAHGWRNEVAGEGISRLVEGRAALAFDGQGGLVLEDRG
jgi:ribonuclease D